MNPIISNYLNLNQVRPGDVIIARNKGIAVLDHHIYYWGVYQNQHFCIGNFRNEGVVWVPEHRILQLIGRYHPAAILRFQGDEYQRQVSLGRAANLVGNRTYHLWDYNCQHFSSEAQYGVPRSYQVDQASNLLKATGIVAGVALTLTLIARAGKSR
ncbi:MAG: hypothetical protein KF690_04480 [Bacteroidetes bacterium]|nr:hypothetical protein [Bacteroidota bacterium]